MIPQSSAILDGMPSLLVALTMKALITSQGVSTHFIRPFEIWLVLDLLQNLIHRFLEQGINHLRSCRPKLLAKIPPRSIIVVAVRPEIRPLLRDDLTLSLVSLLVLLGPLILINPIHELAYTSDRLSSQRLPQPVLRR